MPSYRALSNDRAVVFNFPGSLVALRASPKTFEPHLFAYSLSTETSTSPRRYREADETRVETPTGAIDGCLSRAPRFDRSTSKSPHGRGQIASVAVGAAAGSGYRAPQCSAKVRLSPVDLRVATRHLGAAALVRVPSNAEILRLLGDVMRARGHRAEALQYLRRAEALNPCDAAVHQSLGRVLSDSGDIEGALAAFALACTLDGSSMTHLRDYAEALCAGFRHRQALPILRQLARNAPDDSEAGIQLAHALRRCGHEQEAEAAYREVLSQHASHAVAWIALSRLPSARLSASDIERMESALRDSIDSLEQIGLSFAIARGLEQLGRCADSFHVYSEVNARTRRLFAWSARYFSHEVKQLLDAFLNYPAHAANNQGQEVILVVGLPLAETQLVGRIIASHPRIAGCEPLDDLPRILRENADRRGHTLPAYVQHATTHEWRHLGQLYLERTTSLRGSMPCFVDSRAENWLYVGAALSMLPEARVVIVKHHPLDAALACFREPFDPRMPTFSYDLAAIAAYIRDFDCAMRVWATLFPGRVYVQRIHSLRNDKLAEVERLLGFCGLQTGHGDILACGSVPIPDDAPRPERYGALLDPLKFLLGSSPRDLAFSAQ